jgi:hypothetical protein
MSISGSGENRLLRGKNFKNKRCRPTRHACAQGVSAHSQAINNIFITAFIFGHD